jgi:dephospho-CoA kinase
MIVVGLTGNIASGKSTVARRLAERGVPVIDADVLAREVVAPGEPALARIVERFGREVLASDGSLDRPALRRRVFADDRARADLDAIVHPEVARRRRDALDAARARGERIVVCDVPLLFEAGLADTFDLVVLVDAPEAQRLTRLMRLRGLPEHEARAMLRAQASAAAKRWQADYVIENDGPLAELERRVDKVWNAIERRAAASP